MSNTKTKFKHLEKMPFTEKWALIMAIKNTQEGYVIFRNWLDSLTIYEKFALLAEYSKTK